MQSVIIRLVIVLLYVGVIMTLPAGFRYPQTSHFVYFLNISFLSAAMYLSAKSLASDDIPAWLYVRRFLLKISSTGFILFGLAIALYLVSMRSYISFD